MALQSQSALTLLIALANTDLLAMVPVQWLDFTPVAGVLQAIAVREILPAPDIVLIRRAVLPLTPAATFLVDLFRREASAGSRPDGHASISQAPRPDSSLELRNSRFPGNT